MNYTIVGIGNPLLDTTADVEDDFLLDQDFPRGGMHLIDVEQSARLQQLIRHKNPSLNPGGSVANALASAVALGGRTLFLGAIGEDEFGTEYERLVQGIGIRSALKRVSAPQGSCTVMITPDRERTMATHLGAAILFAEEHLEVDALAETAILHVEGYQLDSPNQTRAARRAMEVVKAAGGRVSMDCSDSWLIKRHGASLESLVDDYVDILFANETEAEELTGSKPEEAVVEIASRVEVAVVTLGPEGSLIMSGEELHHVPAVEIEIVNTNGAGDTFAGAFLQSLVDGRDLRTAGTIAAHLAAQVVAREGSRVEGDHSEFVRSILAGT